MITLPDLRPAMIAAGIVAFFVSFENFNTTLFLVGSEAPLAITILLGDAVVPGSNDHSLSHPRPYRRL